MAAEAGASGTGIWSRYPVLDHAQFRHLLSGGYRDAAEQAGAGFVPPKATDYPFHRCWPWTTSSRMTPWRMEYSACGYPDRTIGACRQTLCSRHFDDPTLAGR